MATSPPANTPTPPSATGPPVAPPLDYHPYRRRPELPAALRVRVGPAAWWGAGVMSVGTVLGALSFLGCIGPGPLRHSDETPPLQVIGALTAIIGACWYLVARAWADARADVILKVQMAAASAGAMFASLVVYASWNSWRDWDHLGPGFFGWLAALVGFLGWFVALRWQVRRASAKGKGGSVPASSGES